MNTTIRIIKMLIEAKDNTYIDSIKEVNDKDPKFKVDDHVRMPKYKNIFAKGCTPNWSEEVFVIKEVKILFHRHMLLMISMLKKLLEHFMKKNYEKQINKDLGFKKSLKEKKINYMSSGKDKIIHLRSGLIKMSQYFPKPY